MYWQSSSAATPKRVIFQDSPEYSFDLPIQQGNSISFPFDSPPIAFKSFSSLENTFLVNDPAGIIATFTGRCGKIFEFGIEKEDPYNSSEELLELNVVNNDQFYEKKIEISYPSYIFTRDGTVISIHYVYYGPSGSQYGMADHLHLQYGSITLGPGQSEKGYLFIPAASGQAESPVMIHLTNAGYDIYDIGECGIK